MVKSLALLEIVGKFRFLSMHEIAMKILSFDHPLFVMASLI